VDGYQPDLSPILLGPLDGDAQVSCLDGPLLRRHNAAHPAGFPFEPRREGASLNRAQPRAGPDR
jgi:hypothetical protein